MAQFIGTKNYGVIEVDRSWQVAQKNDPEGNPIQQGGHIALLVNGAYCHMTGLPINSPDELRAVFCDYQGNVLRGMERVLADSLEWFEHRHENDAALIPEVTFDANGFPKYADGTYLETENEIYQCLKPGPVMTAAIVGLSERRKVTREAEAAKPVFEPAAPPPLEHEVAQPRDPDKSHPMWGHKGKGKGPRGAKKDTKGRFQPKSAPPAQAAEVVTA